MSLKSQFFLPTVNGLIAFSALLLSMGTSPSSRMIAAYYCLDEVALSYAEVKALSAGNPLIKEKMDLDVDVAKLKMLKASYQNAQFDLQDSVLKSLPNQIKNTEKYIQNLKMDIEAYSSLPVKRDDAKGVDVKTVSELLGHSEVSITYDTYIHLIQEQHVVAVETLEDLYNVL